MSQPRSTSFVIFLSLLSLMGSWVAAEDKKVEAAAIIERAAKLSAIEAPGAAPFTLRAHFRSATSTGEKTEGECSLFWVSSDKWRSEVNVNGFSEIVLQGKASKWRLRTGTPTPKVPPCFGYAMSRLFDLKLGEGTKVTAIRRTREHEIPLACVNTESKSDGKIERCFSEASGILVREQNAFYITDYYNYVGFRDKTIPRSLHILQKDRSVMEADIWKVSDEALSDALFTPPAGAEELPVCQEEVKAPKALESPELKFPSKAQPGRVVLVVQVGVDGLAHDPVVVETGGQLLDQTAIEAVSRWRFRPATCKEKPFPVQLQIELNFKR